MDGSSGLTAVGCKGYRLFRIPTTPRRQIKCSSPSSSRHRRGLACKEGPTCPLGVAVRAARGKSRSLKGACEEVLYAGVLVRRLTLEGVNGNYLSDQADNSSKRVKRLIRISSSRPTSIRRVQAAGFRGLVSLAHLKRLHREGPTPSFTLLPHQTSSITTTTYTALIYVVEPRRQMKVAKACYQCRVGKRRCGEGEQGLPCAPCLKRGLGCSLAQRSRGHPVSIRPPIAPTTPTVTDHELSLDLPTTLMLVNLYLELIHNKPHTLFHPASLLLAVEQGTVVPHVLYGILALICR